MLNFLTYEYTCNKEGEIFSIIMIICSKGSHKKGLKSTTSNKYIWVADMDGRRRVTWHHDIRRKERRNSATDIAVLGANEHCKVYVVRCSVCSVQSAVLIEQYVLFSIVSCTLFNMYGWLCNLYYVVYCSPLRRDAQILGRHWTWDLKRVQCTLYTIHYTVYNAQHTVCTV